MMERTSILIVEDDMDFCRLISHAVQREADMKIAGICQTGQEALEAARETAPDLVLMDLNLTGKELDGINIARQIRLRTRARVVILTAYDAPETVIEASTGALASGYVVKSQFFMLIPTIRQTMLGPTPQSHMICASLLSTLSTAEKSIFFSMLGRKTDCHSAQKTIANQQTSVLRKLKLANRQELLHVFAAYFEGLEEQIKMPEGKKKGGGV